MYYDVSWTDKAKCTKTDPEFFFPVGDTDEAIQQTAEAKAFCQSCPVKMKCLEMAFRENLEYGVYGGLDEEERKEWKLKYLLATRRETV